MQRRFAGVIAAVFMGACAPADQTAFTVSPERASFDGVTSRGIFRVTAADALGQPATGPVTFTAPVGRFLGEVTLVDGFATATYACNPNEEAACDGPVRIGAEWQGQLASTSVTVTRDVVHAPVKWEVISTNTTSALLSVVTAPDGVAWAVGEDGTVLRLVGRAWEAVPTPVTTTLRAIAFDGAGQPVVVGYRGTLLTVHEGAFTQVETKLVDDFTAVAVDASGAVHVGTRGGSLLRLDAGQLVLQLSAPGSIEAMAASGDDVWAVGADFTARWIPEAWLLVPSPANANLTSATVTHDGVLFAGSLQGNKQRYGVLVSGPNPSWASSALPAPALAASVSGDERYALTSGGLYLQVGNGDWSKLEVPVQPRALASRGAGDLVLLASPGVSLLRVR